MHVCIATAKRSSIATCDNKLCHNCMAQALATTENKEHLLT